MGHDFGQWREWNAEASIDWHLTRFRYHHGVQQLVRRFNDVYFHERALHEGDARTEAFEWVDRDDAQGGTISWLRWDTEFKEVILAVFNFTPAVYRNFKIGVPRGGHWREVINTDAQEYGGSGQGNFGGVQAAPFGWHGRPNSLVITVPPLAAVAFKSQQGD
jgi:1,4-alpha-glucan branching enzyme